MEERIFQGMEYVYAVYQAGSFRQAAEELFISQPSVSASVRRVEERIGAQIFDRSVKPLQLTDCGREYISCVEQIMNLEREMLEYVNDFGDLRRGTLSLGGSALFSTLLLPLMISRFRKIYPHIHLELIEETTANLASMLDHGTVDLMVDYRIPHPENYERVVLEHEHFLLAVPKSNPVNQGLEAYQVQGQRILDGEHSLNDVDPVPLLRFRDENFILLKPENDSRKRANELCAQAGFQPKPLLEFDQQLTSYHVSCSGMGPCFVSSTLVRRIGPHPDMVYYRMDGQQSMRQICLFWKKGRHFTRAMEEFRRMVVEG